MALFNVRVSDDLAMRFDAWANARGGRSSALRSVMRQACDPVPLMPPPRRDVRPVKLTVRLSGADGRGLDAAAAEMGLTRNAWAAGVIRHRLNGRPTFRRSDHLTLIAVQADVRRIGVNVNQIARALNTEVFEGKVLDLEITYLEALRTELRVHLSTLREAFAGNLTYWDGEP